VSKPVPENTTAAPVAISTTDTPPSRKGVRKAWMLAVLIAAGLAASAATRADEDAERENLARIANEIARLEMMVKEATTSAPTGQRVKFRYDWLQRDLQLVREGVEQHVDAPRQPRPVAPLRGDYRQ
jgi:RAQPRD family integrative conjugative element protein